MEMENRNQMHGAPYFFCSLSSDYGSESSYCFQSVTILTPGKLACHKQEFILFPLAVSRTWFKTKDYHVLTPWVLLFIIKFHWKCLHEYAILHVGFIYFYIKILTNFTQYLPFRKNVRAKEIVSTVYAFPKTIRYSIIENS